jgi:hypothetical protein
VRCPSSHLSLIREHAPKEEGWGEEVAYHPGAGGQQEAKVESGVLYQPLEGLGGEAQSLGTLRLCKVNTGVRGSRQATGSCLYDVGFFGGYGRQCRRGVERIRVCRVRCGWR